MSSARDNSLKQWVFDGADGAARLLKFRSGHAAPPAVVRYYGAGRLLLSAGGLAPARAWAHSRGRLAGRAAASVQGEAQRSEAASQLLLPPPLPLPAAHPPAPAPARHSPSRPRPRPPPAPPTGQDRAFRAFSTIQDAQSRELSQHHTARRAKRLRVEERELKLGAVTALDACDVSSGLARLPLPDCRCPLATFFPWPLARLARVALHGPPTPRPHTHIHACQPAPNSRLSSLSPPAPPPTHTQVRERDWSNVITAHADDTRAYVWRLQRYTLGEWVLFPPPKQLAGAPQALATAVCLRCGGWGGARAGRGGRAWLGRATGQVPVCSEWVPARPLQVVLTSDLPLPASPPPARSRCGNFGFVGGESGRVDRYNMQSGMHRGSYCRDPKASLGGWAGGVAAAPAQLDPPPASCSLRLGCSRFSRPTPCLLCLPADRFLLLPPPTLAPPVVAPRRQRRRWSGRSASRGRGCPRRRSCCAAPG